MQRDPEAGAADPGHGELLGDHLVEAEVGRAAAAESLGDGQPDEAVRAGLCVQRARGDALGLPRQVVRGDLLRHERGEGGTELVVGICFVSGFFVPLASIIISPIVINIFCVHLFIAQEGLPVGILVIVANAFIAYTNREVYRPLFSPKI